MRVTYEQQALAARNHLIARRDDPLAAARLYKRFDATKRLLGRHPYLGREGHRPGTRELIVAGTPYVFIYRVEEQVVTILDIQHSGRLR